VLDQERDQVRQILVAYLDAATWCGELAEISERLIGNARTRHEPSADQLSQYTRTISEIRRHLESNTAAVERIRSSFGLSPGPSSRR
jgi:hypothetical protein